MGKRKERRLAAMMAASRRVKLDLFAEPSGEMVTSSVHDEVGGDPDKEYQAEVPNSPSSSGKKENPLMLLEQYSDDELDEECSKHPIQTAEENVSIDPLVQVEETVAVDVIAENKANNIDDAVDLSDGQLENTNNIESYDTIESDIASAAAQGSKGAPESQPVLDSSGMQVVGDLTGSWKVVMHEQSNQYYYWNTTTGETSWEVPHGLSLEVPTNGVNLSSTIEGQVNYPVLLEANIPVSNMHGGISSSIEPYGTVEMTHTDGQATSNALLDYSRSSADLASYEGEHATKISECYAMTDVQPASLVEYAQNLLHRLKTLTSYVDRHEWVAKEIELRISDCKALSSYGSSLIPFWWHTETQLKQLESVIAGAEVSSIPDESTVDNVGPSRVVEENNTLYNGEIPYSIPDIDTNVTQTETDMKKPENEDTACLGSNGVRTNICEEAVNSISKAELPTEDVDMDVEMEVDDETTVVHPTYPTTESPVPVETAGLVGPASVSHPNEPNVPPLPDEEWIPPPPPDNEIIPPPPPEDPPEPSYPPPYADVLPLPTQDPYSFGYVLPSYNYYAPNGSEVTNLNYYVQGDGSQIVEAPQPSYYEPVVSSTYPEIVVHVNQVEPISYYDVSGGHVSHIPVVSGTASAGFYVETSAVSYGSVSSLDQASALGPAMDSANKSVSPGKHDSDVSAIFKEPSKSSLSAISDTSGVQIASKDLVNGSTMVAPVSNKNKSKVLRARKATVAGAPSLRSNKKVSSLVDKWKAAKEELHGEDDDDEPVDALEILEKKRQKEIKEWHARQIATGEAQDNANFLPLGGDWRERVKRRRAEAAKSDVVEYVLEAAADNAKKLPDLVELSKDLPSGWQAYWDESSKEVYYGNSITSETTWVRPTR